MWKMGWDKDLREEMRGKVWSEEPKKWGKKKKKVKREREEKCEKEEGKGKRR